MGGYSQVLYQKALLTAAFAAETPNVKFDRFVVITGQDYPLMANSEIVRLYEEHPKRLWIKGLNKTLHHKESHSQFTLYHFCRDWKFKNPKVKQAFSFSARQIMRILPFRKKPYIVWNDGTRWDVWQSSSYLSLTHDAARFVLEYITNNTIEKYFKYSFVPEEKVIPTIIFNSPFRKHAFVYEKQQYDGLITLSCLEHFYYNKFIKTYTEADYEELVHCGKMFARKLETGKSDKLMDMLDEHNGLKL